MNKTDNLELLARPPARHEQLSIPLPPVAPPPLTLLQQQQRANLEALFQQAAQESNLFLQLVQQAHPEAGYTQLKDVSTAHLGESRPRLEAHPDYQSQPYRWPHPEICTNYHDLAASLFDLKPVAPEPPKDYKPWTELRRQRTAVANLLKRFHKRYSLGELWIDQAQARILKEPWRFGCCPLPTEGSCFIPDPARILARAEAIAAEQALRQADQNLYHPGK